MPLRRAMQSLPLPMHRLCMGNSLVLFVVTINIVLCMRVIKSFVILKIIIYTLPRMQHRDTIDIGACMQIWPGVKG